MRGSGFVACGVLAISLGGCVTANTQFARIGPGPELAYAKAQCEISASSVDRGYVAWGSTSYVAGAAIGNALGNAIRESQFMKNCMILNGWQAVPEGAAAPAQVARAEAPTRQRAETVRYGGPTRMPYGGLNQSD